MAQGPADFDSVVIERLHKTFGERAVLKDVSIRLSRGEMLTVLGTSGAGKTTLIRCLAGLELPTSGRLWLASASGRSSSISPSMISVVFQDLNIVRQLSALENVIAAIGYDLSIMEMIFRVYRRSIEIRALDALAEVGLEGHARARADKLSGGQQQRVAIARAIARQSALILADEPVASLDQQTSREVLHVLKRSGRARGATIVCSLHQVELALEFSDRVIGLRDGAIVFDGAPKDLTRSDVEAIYPPLASLREMEGAIPRPERPTAKPLQWKASA